MILIIQAYYTAAAMPGKCYLPSKRATIAQAALSTPYRTVAARFGCSISTVSQLVSQQRTCSTSRSPPRPGRPSALTPRTLSCIKLALVENRCKPLAQIIAILKEVNIIISLSTLRRIMKHKLGFKRRIARTKPLLNKQARSLRLIYAKKHQGDDANDWRRTIFVDEAAIRLNGTIRTWVTRRDGEAWLEECMMPKLMSARKACMVWAAIWHGGRS